LDGNEIKKKKFPIFDLPENSQNFRFDQILKKTCFWLVLWRITESFLTKCQRSMNFGLFAKIADGEIRREALELQ